MYSSLVFILLFSFINCVKLWDENFYDTLSSEQIGNEISDADEFQKINHKNAPSSIHKHPNSIDYPDDIVYEYLNFYNKTTDTEFLGVMGDFVPSDANNPIQDSHVARLNAIFPGTKWCGVGNRALNDDDLGLFADADACCRQHDHCEDYINAGETKHGLTNNGFTGKLLCSCDMLFYDCLKQVNTIVSNKLGRIYFNIAQNECFKLEFPIKECKRYTFMWKRCAEYTLDTSAAKKYQWFYNPYY